MSAPGPSIVYVLPDKMGGMFTAIARLIEYRPQGSFGCHAVLTHNRASGDTRSDGRLAADTTSIVEYGPDENLWAVVRRVARAIPAGPGVVVTGDLLDLATASAIDSGRAVIFVLHGSAEYYQDLAVRHERAIHAFVAVSDHIAQELRRRLPHRTSEIHRIRHGVPPAERRTSAVDGPLRAVFVGRLDANKGVLDLPAIDRRLSEADVAVRWTIVGEGPLGGRLRAHWPTGDRVRFTGAVGTQEVARLLAEQDVFVLPSRSEGLPVALLEAASAGVVPVVTALPSGVGEIVTSGDNGYCVPAGDVGGFATAVAGLARDRRLLERMSARAIETTSRFDMVSMVARYYALFARYADLYRPLGASARLAYGSRLDRRWIPNSVVKAIRRAGRAAPGSTS